jgi:predicted metal-dependent phosphoesterase TrpH
MLEKGYIASLKEAFNSYIGRGGPAYVERRKLVPVAAVDLILRAKGLPVMAHPFTVSDPEALVVELKAAGLVGIEAYYPDYSADEVKELKGLAEKYNLAVTGGSDYHGLDAGSGIVIGGVPVPLSAAEHLMALASSPLPS